MEEKESGKRYFVLRDEQRLILCKRVANKHNPAYHPVWWSLKTSVSKAQIRRPSKFHRLWLITDEQEWTTVKIYGQVLDTEYKLDIVLDSEIYQHLKNSERSV
jgi:hypothetical protein